MCNDFKSARKRAGLTQQQMADMFKIPKRTLENWESGSRTPPEYVKLLVLEKLNRISTETGER